MASAATPKFRNDAGVASIRTGVRKLECIGATPPYDHPHIYLDMGDEREILCPYCSTLYRFDSGLDQEASDPPGALYRPVAASRS